MNPLDSIFEWLLAATLRASVLAVIILGIQLVLRRWLPAQWRYALWLPMLLVMLLPALPEVPFGWSPKKSAGIPAIAMQAPAVSDPVVSGGEEAWVPMMGKHKARIMNPFAIVWIIGAAAVFAAGMIGYRRSLRKMERDAITPDEALLRTIHLAADEVGLKRMPRVLVSPMVGSPAVTGVFRHALLLPAGFPKGFSDPETRMILLHELSHLKRHDLAVNWLACALQALHWFNPILWFAFARMRADREAACDAQVLSIGATDRRAEYGSALLKLQGAFSSHGLSLGFVGIFERSAGMKSRIREISVHRRSGLAGRVCGAGIVALLIAFGATKAQEPAKPKAPAEADGKAAKPRSPGQIAIDRKLDTIIIPRVDFEDTTLEEGIDFFRLRSVELDRDEVKPNLKGINIVVLLPPPGTAEHQNVKRVTLEKKNATLRELIVEICQLAGMEFRVDDNALTIYPPGGMDTARRAEPKPKPAGAAADFASKLIIPRIDFEDVTLQEAVDFLNKKAKDVAKEGPVFPILLDPKADPNARVREIRIKNAPLFAALQYITEACGHTWTANDKELRIQRK